jgi:hypothetical protein
LNAEKETQATSTLFKIAERRVRKIKPDNYTSFYNLAFNQPNSPYAQFIAEKTNQWFAKFWM